MPAAPDVSESEATSPSGPARGRVPRWALGRTPGRGPRRARRKPRTPPGTIPRWAQDPEPVGPARQAAGTMLTILAVALIGFAIWLSFGSRLYYARVQHEAYQSLRVPLANGTAPVGPTDPYDPGKLVALGTPVALLKIPALHM